MNVFSTVTKLLFVVAAIAVFLHMAWWWGKLPEIVPSHFDAQGLPDGTMKKSAFVALMSGIQLFHITVIGSLSLFMSKLPNWLFNLPNREYWLTPERRDNTIQRTQNVLLNIGTMTMIFVGILFHLSSKVAVNQRASIDPEFAWVLGIYMAAILGMVVWMYWKYRLPANPIE